MQALIANNRRAFYDYFVEDEIEAGIVLLGTELKPLREGKVKMIDAYVTDVEGELYVVGLSIPEHKNAKNFSHAPLRPRKLLLSKSQIRKLLGFIKKKGCTIVPLKMYFNQHNKVKIEIGVVRGKKQYDKRETIKQRDWEREKARLAKNQSED